MRQQLSRAHDSKNVRELSKLYHVGDHWKALAECSQMRTNMHGLQSCVKTFLHHFVLSISATSIKRVNFFTTRSNNFRSSCAPAYPRERLIPLTRLMSWSWRACKSIHPLAAMPQLLHSPQGLIYKGQTSYEGLASRWHQ